MTMVKHFALVIFMLLSLVIKRNGTNPLISKRLEFEAEQQKKLQSWVLDYFRQSLLEGILKTAFQSFCYTNENIKAQKRERKPHDKLSTSWNVFISHLCVIIHFLSKRDGQHLVTSLSTIHVSLRALFSESQPEEEINL